MRYPARPVPSLPAVPFSAESGGGGGAGPITWTECTTLAEIQAEIADGAQILVTADINLGAAEQIELVAGTVTIGRKAGVTIAGGSGEPIFLADGNIAARLILVDDHPATDELGNSTAFLASHASVGPLCEVTSGSALAVEAKRLTINLAAGGSLAGDGQRLGLDIGSLVAKCPDGSAVFASEFGAIRHIETLGGGSTASIALNTDVHGGRISGELRSSVFGAGITVAPNTGRSRVTCGPLNGAYAESTGVLVHVFDATLIECPGAKLYAYGNGPQILGGKTAELFLGGLSVGGKAASFVGIEATRMTELGTTYRANFEGCRWAPNGADTITSYGEGSTWDGGEFYAGGGSITFATGAQWSISGAVGGIAITLSSGAQMRVRDSELAGIVNSDQLSIITGSRGDALALDTTPATFRFGHATLDPLLDAWAGYYRLDQSASPFRDIAPQGSRLLFGMNGSFTEQDLIGDGAGIGFTEGAWLEGKGYSPLVLPWGSDADFGIYCLFRFGSAPGTAKLIFSLGDPSSTYLSVELQTGRTLNLYNSGIGDVIVGATVLATNTVYLISLERAAGTFTLRVNATSQGTSASAHDNQTRPLIQFGRLIGVTSWPATGRLAHVGLLRRSIGSAAWSALYNSGSFRTLKGAA